ncbi:MAG: LmeA family phospholipid-binding protein [Streptosporangiaceae bacterium]
MSSDSTGHSPDWWQQPGSQDSQDTPQGSQGQQGSPPQPQGQQYPPGQYQGQQYQGQQDPARGYQGSQEPATNVYRGYQVPPPPPNYQANQGSQNPPPQYQGQQDQPPYYGSQQDQPAFYGGPQGEPPVYQGTPPLYQGGPAVRRRRRRRWPIITLIVIVVLLVAADRAGAAITENAIASQIQSNLDLSGKPHVTVEGIPFLTQLAARDFKTVDINGTDETTGPLEISKLTATLHGMHLLSLNSARIDQFNAMAVVTFAALANAGGIPQGITLSAGPNNTIMATVSILGFNSTATAQVTRTGTNTVNIKITKFGGLPPSVLGSLVNFNINLPKLPAGVSIGTISVTQQGLSISATGKNVTLSQ